MDKIGFPLIDFNGHVLQISSVNFLQGHKYIISASNDRTLRIWDLSYKKLIHVFHGMVPLNYGI